MQKNFNLYNIGLNTRRKQKRNYLNVSQWPSCPPILAKSKGNLISVGLTANKWRGLPYAWPVHSALYGGLHSGYICASKLSSNTETQPSVLLNIPWHSFGPGQPTQFLGMA